MPPEPIYLDHNATTPLGPAAAEAMRSAGVEAYANPASQHGPGRNARRRLEGARERILTLLGGETSGRAPDRLVFTSGGTESNALALRGLLAASGRKRLVVSAIEHPSVAATADRLEGEGCTVDRLGATDGGVVRLDALRELLSRHGGEIGLVSLMAASNETGVLQPIAEAARLCHEAGVPFHTDAAQLVGKRPIEFRSWGAAALSFTAHKFNGPLGVGGLLLAPEVTPAPQLHGGFQQESLRPGTESAPLAAGLAAALETATEGQTERRDRLKRLRDQFERALLASWPGAVALGAETDRLEHTSCLAFPGADRQALVMAYDLAGVACSTGSACASGSSEPSPTLLAMGLPEKIVRGAVRFSLGATTTEAQINDAITRLTGVHERLRSEAIDTPPTR
ncbi:Cysteine desulfurase [Planctomycetes bacterium MalM25]|nr:Cysteine desulfurase [Planctomycetes bacterium MalM25]